MQMKRLTAALTVVMPALGHSRQRSSQPQARPCPQCPDSDRISQRREMSRWARRQRISFGKVPLGRGGLGVNFWNCRKPVFTHFV
jgi:hypothetical protein